MPGNLLERAPRVLYCTDTYPPQVNGVSVVAALSIAGLRARGWRCAVVAPRYPATMGNPFAGGPDSTVDIERSTIPSVPTPGYEDIRLAAPQARRIEKAIRDFAPDIVHCQTEFVIGRLGQRAAARAGIPMVSSYHTDFGRYATAYGVPWLRPAVTSYIARFHQRSLVTYTPSAPARDDLRALGVPQAQVWGRGVDTTQFSPRRRNKFVRQAYGLGDRFTFLHVGRLASEKGIDHLLKAYSQARRLLPAGDVHLVVAGAGPKADELRASAPGGVTFLGNLDRQKVLPELYASCDAFLFASLTETLGLVVLEAMASGLPVIAIPAGGVADHLRHGVNGIAVDAGDLTAMAHAMVDIVLDRELRDRLTLGARQTAETLDWERELDRLDASYRTVIASAGRRAVADHPIAAQRVAS